MKLFCPFSLIAPHSSPIPTCHSLAAEFSDFRYGAVKWEAFDGRTDCPHQKKTMCTFCVCACVVNGMGGKGSRSTARVMSDFARKKN